MLAPATTIWLQYPEALPTISWGQRCSPSTDVTPLLAGLPPGGRAERTIERLSDTVERIRQKWRTSSDERPAQRSGLDPRQQEFDQYFHVERASDHDAATAFYEAVVIAYHGLLTESLKGRSLLPVEYGQLCGSVEHLLYALGHAEQRGTAAPLHAVSASPAPCDVDAMERWRTGHQMFFTLIQALIVVHGWLVSSLREHRIKSARESLALATNLWWASAAAFRFAGDFPAAAYNEVVRPSMSPPHVSEGFSGLLFADHAFLLQQLKHTRPFIERLPAALHQQHRQYLWGMTAMYESHAYVCERFVGDEASLRGAGKKEQGGAPSVIRGALRERALHQAGAPASSPHTNNPGSEVRS